MYSFIALSPVTPPEGSGRQEDGLLHSWEIMNLHSAARLVVLSASSMKRERVGSGDAAIALVWSWFVAGTPAAVISRWEVESPSVTQLMTEFHTRLRSQPGLKRSDSKADALQQSALTLRRSREYQHPYYWSGFALLGEGR
jgi:CHAT domain-containing protein